MKKLFSIVGMCIIMCLTGYYSLQAQQKIGGAPGAVNPSAILELESANRGLLLPRVALTATNLPNPLSAHVAGMIVYNTATAGSGNTAVSPGLYLNDGTKWRLVWSTDPEASSGGDAIVSLWTCAGTLSGSMKAGTPVSGVTKVVTAM